MSAFSGLLPAFCFDTKPAKPARATQTAQQDVDARGGTKLCCRSCRRAITDESEKTSVAGSHAHTRSNPHGISFHIGCFAAAPGCGAVGRATEEHSWFAGCRWRIAICGGCGEHLGWLFTGAQRFFGLILARLIAEAP